jgi:trehalose-phosphatase
MEYLFKCWERLKETLANKYILLFLDYDGTLTPIVESPADAVIPRQTKELLRRLSKNPQVKLSIVSGRALKNVKGIVGIKDIIYVGNHGLEIEGPKIRFESPVSPRLSATITEIKEELSEKLSAIKGAFVEDKGLTLSVHYRLVHKKLAPLVKTIVHETLILHVVKNIIKIKPGKKVLEIRPPVEWDKGKVALWLLVRQLAILEDKNVLPIYVGDDLTDEDAFKALRNKGLTVFVGKPTASYARYYLKNTGEVTEFLKRILALQETGNI